MHLLDVYLHPVARAKFRAGVLFARFRRLRVALTWTVLP